MAFTIFVPKPGGPAGPSQYVWGGMPNVYWKVGYSGTTVEDSGWLDTSQDETLQLAVRGADATNAMQLYGSASTFDGQDPNGAEVIFPIGGAITSDVNEFVEPVPEKIKLGRTTTDGGSVTATMNGFKRARTTGSR